MAKSQNDYTSDASLKSHPQTLTNCGQLSPKCLKPLKCLGFVSGSSCCFCSTNHLETALNKQVGNAPWTNGQQPLPTWQKACQSQSRWRSQNNLVSTMMRNEKGLRSQYRVLFGNRVPCDCPRLAGYFIAFHLVKQH